MEEKDTSLATGCEPPTADTSNEAAQSAQTPNAGGEVGKKRSSFTGKIGFVLAAAGSAVGLGNIWRFPYLAAKYGGGIFILT